MSLPLSLLAPPGEPPSDPVHALVSWHVAGLFALASRPCERHILTNGAMAEVLVEVVVCVRRWRQYEGGGGLDEQLKGLCALHVRGNVWLVYLNV